MLYPSHKAIQEAVDAYRIQQYQRFSERFSITELEKLRHAAVIIPLLVNEGRWHVLLTHRSQELVEHRGQVAFPGGARERADVDLQATALREMYEEIGVHPRDVQVFGRLGDMPILTGYCVRLFVGMIPWPYQLKLNPDEVESAFIVPLEWLVDPNHRTVQCRSYAGREFSVIFFDLYEGHQLWGASAEMTMALLEALNLVD
jgi:8-oxo-dGTP pyrophosphatase MutT (NUDIX family)